MVLENLKVWMMEKLDVLVILKPLMLFEKFVTNKWDYLGKQDGYFASLFLSVCEFESTCA